MPNKRAAGTVVTSLALPAELLTAARVKAAEQGTTVSAVVRKALERYIR